MQPYTKTPENCIVAYISGYCRTPRGRAAFALTIRRIENGEVVEKSQIVLAADATTANERTVAALLLLLQCLQTDETLPIVVRSSIEYPLRGVTEWRADWKRQGWKTSSKKPVTCLETWVEIDVLLEEFEEMPFGFQWVPPSANDGWNAEAVDLAKRAVAA
jgi:ribonuclease HI